MASAATEIGEQDEIERLSIFLRQLNPEWDSHGGGQLR